MTHVQDSERLDLSILVVNYNTRDLTLAAIQSAIQETEKISIEIICVDNASRDGSTVALKNLGPDIRLLLLNQNVGFAQANNLAARLAKGRRLLLLNPDTITIDRGIEKLWQFAETHPDYGIWGGRTLFEDGTLNPTSCWGEMTPWTVFCWASGLTFFFPRSSIFNSEAYGGWKRDSDRKVDIVTGCFFMIDRTLWDALGGFDPTFFMYGEEADLCLRARRLGADPAITKDATVIHLGGRSESSNSDKTVKVLRAKTTLMRRHWSKPKVALGLSLFWFAVYLRKTAQFLLDTKPSRVRNRAIEPNLWRTVWQRRGEWLSGWSTVPRDVKSYR